MSTHEAFLLLRDACDDLRDAFVDALGGPNAILTVIAALILTLLLLAIAALCGMKF